MAVEDRGDLGPPLGPLGHGRQELELEHDPGHLKGDGALEDVPGHLLVMAAHLGPVGLDQVDDREREVDLGEDSPAPIVRSKPQRTGTRRPAEDQIARVSNGCFRILTSHFCSLSGFPGRESLFGGDHRQADDFLRGTAVRPVSPR